MPSPGRIDSIAFPSGNGVRVDSHVFDGYTVPCLYDSLIAKVIVHGKYRAETIQKMIASLDRFHVSGIDTTVPFHKEILTNEMFWDGRINTRFVEDYIDARKTAAITEERQLLDDNRQVDRDLEAIRELLTV